MVFFWCYPFSALQTANPPGMDFLHCVLSWSSQVFQTVMVAHIQLIRTHLKSIYFLLSSFYGGFIFIHVLQRSNHSHVPVPSKGLVTFWNPIHLFTLYFFTYLLWLHTFNDLSCHSFIISQSCRSAVRHRVTQLFSALPSHSHSQGVRDELLPEASQHGSSSKFFQVIDQINFLVFMD